jgi:hypothetical protein
LAAHGILGGTFEIGQREALQLGPGMFDLTGSPTFRGIAGGVAGSVRVGVTLADDQGSAVSGNCTLNVNSDTIIPRVEFLNGMITGPALLDVTDYFLWQRGLMWGDGTTSIEQNATLHFDLSMQRDGRDLDRYLNNYGKVSWDGKYLVSRVNQNAQFSAPTTYDNDQTGNDNLLRYVNAVDPAWANFIQAMNNAWNDLQDRENAADAAYIGVIDTLDPPTGPSAYRDRLAAADRDYETALNADPSGAQYWDNLSAADATWDQRRTDALLFNTPDGPGFVPTEQQAFETRRAAVNSARDTYRSALSSAYSTFTAAVRNGGSVPGHGLIRDRVEDVVQLMTTPPAFQSRLIPFFCSLSADARAALAVAYNRIEGRELVDAIKIYFDLSIDAPTSPECQATLDALFHGQQVGTDETQYGAGMASSLSANSTAVGTWGQGIANAFANIFGQTAAQEAGAAVNAIYNGVSGGAVSSWRYVTGFVRDVNYLARNDPTALVSAAGEGLRDGAVITANAFTFDLCPGLSQEANHLVDQNGGLYQVSAFSANLSRELLITSLTMGASAAAQGGRLGFVASRLADYPRVACAVTSASRAYQPIAAYYHVAGTIQAGMAAGDAVNRGDYGVAALQMFNAGLNAMGASGALRQSAQMGRAAVRAANSGNLAPLQNYLVNCFAAGTPILGEHGSRPIEEYRAGDKVWARDENNPDSAPALKSIEECFVNELPIWHVHIGGQVVRTTDEHPFWVERRGWTATKNLLAGDRILGRTGETAVVEEVFATGLWETVYNFRVAEYHTYFVGEESWGFAVWAHNTCAPAAYNVLRRNPQSGSQAHHLNQDAAFRAVIPHGQGICIWLQGSVQQVGSQHNLFHQSMNQFWAPYQRNGALFGQKPTCQQYGAALRRALNFAGIADQQARQACLDAIHQRREFGLLGADPVPRVPGT